METAIELIVSLRPSEDAPQDTWNIEAGLKTKLTVSRGASVSVIPSNSKIEQTAKN